MTPVGPRTAVQDKELLDADRAGDERAFERLLEPYRNELHAHCCRMLGSPHDTEDGYARWPEYPPSPELVRSVFERRGLPSRVEQNST